MTQPDDRDAALIQRLARLREQDDAGPAPEHLWRRIRASPDLAEQMPSNASRASWFVRSIAASALLALGFGLGRTTAAVPQAVGLGAGEDAALAMQAAGTRFVHALDRIAAVDDSLPADRRAEYREVTLVALGAAIAAGATEFPDDVPRLLSASRRDSTVGASAR